MWIHAWIQILAPIMWLVALALGPFKSTFHIVSQIDFHMHWRHGSWAQRKKVQLCNWISEEPCDSVWQKEGHPEPLLVSNDHTQTTNVSLSVSKGESCPAIASLRRHHLLDAPQNGTRPQQLVTPGSTSSPAAPRFPLGTVPKWSTLSLWHCHLLLSLLESVKSTQPAQEEPEVRALSALTQTSPPNTWKVEGTGPNQSRGRIQLNFSADKDLVLFNRHCLPSVLIPPAGGLGSTVMLFSGQDAMQANWHFGGAVHCSVLALVDTFFDGAHAWLLECFRLKIVRLRAPSLVAKCVQFRTNWKKTTMPLWLWWLSCDDAPFQQNNAFHQWTAEQLLWMKFYHCWAPEMMKGFRGCLEKSACQGPSLLVATNIRPPGNILKPARHEGILRACAPNCLLRITTSSRVQNVTSLAVPC